MITLRQRNPLSEILRGLIPSVDSMAKAYKERNYQSALEDYGLSKEEIKLLKNAPESDRNKFLASFLENRQGSNVDTQFKDYFGEPKEDNVPMQNRDQQLSNLGGQQQLTPENLISRLSGLGSLGQGLPPSVQRNMPSSQGQAFTQPTPPRPTPRKATPLTSNNLAKFKMTLKNAKDRARFDDLMKALKEEEHLDYLKGLESSKSKEAVMKETREASRKGYEKPLLTNEIMDYFLSKNNNDVKKAIAEAKLAGYEE